MLSILSMRFYRFRRGASTRTAVELSILSMRFSSGAHSVAGAVGVFQFSLWDSKIYMDLSMEGWKTFNSLYEIQGWIMMVLLEKYSRK